MSRISYPEVKMKILAHEEDEATTPIMSKVEDYPAQYTPDYPAHYTPDLGPSPATSDTVQVAGLWFGLPPRTWLTVVTVLISGFLFGYDIGIMSGVIVKLSADTRQDTVNWGVANSDFRKELIVTMTIAMAALGALVSGKVNGRIGRKYTLAVGAGVFAVSGVAMGTASTWYWLTAGRALAGIAIGLLSMTAPVYISEQMSTEWRGPINVCNQFTITLGILVASLIAGVFSTTPSGWRWMLGLSVVPAVLMLLLLCHIPESYRWLVGQGRVEEGREVLVQMRGTKYINQELDEVLEERQQTAEQEQITGISHLREMYYNTAVRRALTLGVLLQTFQQLTGINSVIYYSTTIIIKAGISNISDAIWIAAVVGAVNSLFTILGLYLVERIGRKPLLIGSLVGMSVGLSILTLTFYLIYEKHVQSIAWMSVLGLLVYCAGFAPGMGPLPWTINSEIFPSWCRNTAISITTTTCWVCNSVVSMTFLSIANSIGTSEAFMIYLMVTLVAIVYFTMFLPETKDVPLEQVQNIFKSQAMFPPFSPFNHDDVVGMH